MTDVAEGTTETAAPVSPMRQRLAAAAAKSGTRATKRAPARKTTARKTTTAPKSRGERASARGQHAKRIAPMIKMGSSLVAMRNPVAARIIANRADPFANALDAVAAEDPRVDALLTRIANWAGKGGAWGELARESAVMAGGIMLASGAAPTGGAGVVLSLFAGAVVQQATLDVADQIVFAEFEREGHLTAEGDPINRAFYNERVQQIAAELIADREMKAAARAASRSDDEDQGAEPEPEQPRSPFSGWGS